MVDTVLDTLAVGALGLRNPGADNGLWPIRIPVGSLFISGNGPVDKYAVNGDPIGLTYLAGGMQVTIYDDTPMSEIATTFLVDFTLPQNFVEGESFTITWRAKWETYGADVTTASILVSASLVDEDGGGALIDASPETAVAKDVATNYSLVVDPGPAPGDTIRIALNTTLAGVPGDGATLFLYGAIIVS